MCSPERPVARVAPSAKAVYAKRDASKVNEVMHRVG